MGLYINPGQPIKIRHKHTKYETKNIKLQINLNNNLEGYDNGHLDRFPNISRSFEIKDE